MMRWLSWLAGGALLLYPLAVYWGLTHAGQTPLLLGLLLIFSLRLLPGLLKGRVRLGLLPEWLWLGRLLACIGLGLTLLSALFSARHWLLYYPLAVSLALLCLFGWSLTRPMSLVERLARLQDPALPPAAIGYTRRVTQVWCGFFVINGALAAKVTVFTTIEGAKAACMGMRHLSGLEAYSLQALHAELGKA